MCCVCLETTMMLRYKLRYFAGATLTSFLLVVTVVFTNRQPLYTTTHMSISLQRATEQRDVISRQLNFLQVYIRLSKIMHSVRPKANSPTCKAFITVPIAITYVHTPLIFLYWTVVQ